MDVVELTGPVPAAVVALCRAAFDVADDAAEAAGIVGRLWSRPTGRLGFVAREPGAAAPTGVVLASVSAGDPAVGHVDLVAVDPAGRRRGTGRALLARAEAALAAHGARTVLLAGNPPYYAWPGVDVRYTPAVCAALALGYAHDRTAWNMTADLSRPDSPGLRPTRDAEARLAAAGVDVRRATAADRPALVEFARVRFTDIWAGEVADSIGRDGAGCHLAHRGDELLGFAAYGSSRPSWFGPMGTAPAARGLGIGGILLRRCLAEQRAAGHRRVQIGWVGPVPFYAGVAGARIERVFFQFRKGI